MKRTRIIALALALISILLLFSACSGSVPEERWVPVTAEPARTTAVPELSTCAAALPTTEPPTYPVSEEPTLPETEALTEPAPVPTEEATTLPVETNRPDNAKETATTVPCETETSPERTSPKQTEPKQTEPKPTEPEQTEPKQTEPRVNYVANTNTKKFHVPTCSSVTDMKESNKWYFTGTRDELIAQGYEPCKRCKP